MAQVLEATRMVKVQVRLHDDADVLRCHADACQTAGHGVVGLQQRLKHIGHVTEPRAWIGAQRRVRARVEQHVALRMRDDVHVVRVVERLARLGMLVVEDPDVLQIAAAMECVDLHGENLTNLDPGPDSPDSC